MTQHRCENNTKNPSHMVEEELSNLKTLKKEDLEFSKEKMLRSTFPHFLELPDEIQIAIWRLAAPRVRILRLERKYENEHRYRRVFDATSRIYICPEKQATAATCFKSRVEALKGGCYQLGCYYMSHAVPEAPKTLMIDTARDVLLIPDQSISEHFREITFRRRFKRTPPPKDPIYHLKYIAIEWELWKRDFSMSRGGMNQLIAQEIWQYAKDFENLEEVLVILPLGNEEAADVKSRYEELSEHWGHLVANVAKDLRFVDITWRQLRERATQYRW